MQKDILSKHSRLYLDLQHAIERRAFIRQHIIVALLAIIMITAVIIDVNI